MTQIRLRIGKIGFRTIRGIFVMGYSAGHTGLALAARSIGAAVLLGLMVAGPAQADVKEGVDAWSRGDYDTAVQQWQIPANKGDADAMFNMGQAYKLGRGVPRDMGKAEDYYRRAAQKGHVRAADNYGILLFQTSRQSEALPWLNAAADRGEPRAMYILGIAAYNGDYAPKDVVRAYALMTRAAATGLQQAQSSLAAMNDGIPLEQRQQGVAMAEELDRKAAANRSREMGAADLGAAAPVAAASAAPAGPSPRVALAPSTMAPAGPATAGAAYAQPVTMPARPVVAARPAATKPMKLAPVTAPGAPTPVAAPAMRHDSGGDWRLQLGAFGQKANADGLWAKVRGRPEIAGHARIDAGTGISRLMAGGYSQDGAKAACASLKAAGLTCVVVNR
ncbi:SPOR domain-containing protein [Novosphingobium sp.]|uniref:SPOR domain-containing protein n=1 Tax=Novosphingobium sp. TaxID=1874826 RepID=UPI003D126731